MSDNKTTPFLSFTSQEVNSAHNNYESFASSFQWPSILEEAKEMTEASILVYALADLRGLLRMGKLSANDESRILEFPVTVSDVFDVVQKNLDALKASFGENGVDFYLSSLNSIQQSLRHRPIDDMSGEVCLETSHLVLFDDENAANELVYGIAVNMARKRITVGFRGSVTLSDFLADAKSLLIHRSSPIEGDTGTIGIHHGFHDYLFGTKKTAINKCEKIMDHLVELVKKYPDFKIYTTGHSLGGALSTLFALEAAADPRLPKPISCFSIASPKVGSISFRKAFQRMEALHQLRCLRVANNKDIITLFPDRGSLSCLYIICCQSNVYRHVGMEMTLYSSSSYSFSRSSACTSYTALFLRDWRRQFKNAAHVFLTLPFILFCREDFLKYHGCSEYVERIAGNGRQLQYQYLNELYAKGHAIPESSD
jgi:Lipase (class 3)